MLFAGLDNYWVLHNILRLSDVYTVLYGFSFASACV